MATIKTLACRRALIFIEELSIFEAIFEGDVEVIIKALLDGEMDQLEYGHVIQDNLVLTFDFRVCNFTHVKCLGNFVAYFFAKRSKLGLELQVWIKSTLDDIAPIVTRDSL